MTDNKKKLILKEIINTLESVILAVLVFLVIHNFIFVIASVDGDSMNPTLSHNQKIIASKISYIIGEPDRFDIVVINTNTFNEKYIIKRIIGMPGERIRIDDSGNIYINDEILEEDFGNDVIRDAGIASNEITLGNNEYFVLGDNRNNSLDSRYSLIGVINQENILAKAIILKIFE